MWSPLDRMEVDSFKFKCVMISKVEVIEDWGPFEHRRSKVRNFNYQNLGLMLLVFVYISNHLGAIHRLNVRRNLKRKSH